MTKYKFTKEQKQWLKALRSGKYKQTKGYLTEVKGKKTFNCCLGVACEIFKKPLDLLVEEEETGKKKILTYNGYEVGLPVEVQKLLKLTKSDGTFDGEFKIGRKSYVSLITMNDARGQKALDFNQIADFIEAHPELLFNDAD